MKTLFCAVLLALATTGCIGISSSSTSTTVIVSGEKQSVIALPPHDVANDVMQALSNRKSTRTISGEPLDLQNMSNLLWAAWGINREDGKRTAPSARNWQEIDLYVITAAGVYLYDAPTHQLQLVLGEDIRSIAGKQPFPKKAGQTLVYVANYDRITGVDNHAEKRRYASLDLGFIAQNVYLYCASEGLATTIIGMVDGPAIAKKLGLSDTQEVLCCQPFGKVAN